MKQIIRCKESLIAPFLSTLIFLFCLPVMSLAVESQSVFKDQGRELLIAQRGLRSRDDKLISAALSSAYKKKDKKLVADIQSISGLYNFYISNYKAAMKFYTQALHNYSLLDDQVDVAIVYTRMAEIFVDIPDVHKAERMLEIACPILTKHDDQVGLGHFYRLKGRMAFFDKQIEESLNLLQKSIDHYSRTNDLVGMGRSYFFIAEVYLMADENDKALNYYEMAEKCFLKEDDFRGLGFVNLGKGQISYKGNFEKALQFFEEAKKFFKKAKYIKGLGDINKNEADVFRFVGNFGKALSLYKKAFEYYRQTDSVTGKANVSLRMGNCYFLAGNKEKALEFYKNALRYYEDSQMQLRGNVFLEMGNIFFSKGDTARADEYYHRALDFFEPSHERRGIGEVYLYGGDILAQRGDRSRALENYEKAEKIFATGGYPEYQADAVFRKASLLASDARTEEAANLYDESVKLLEKVRRQSGFDDLKKSFMEKVYDKYESVTLFMLRNSYGEKAFHYTESMKARVFLDQLAEGLVDLEKGIDPDLKRRRDRLENTISSLNKQKNDEVKKAKIDETRIGWIDSEISKADAELEEIRIQIRHKNPLYAAVRYPEPVTVSELREILGNDEVVLEYFVSREGVFCFIVDKNKYEIINLPVRKDDLIKNVTEFVSYVSTRGNYFKKNALKLYGYLVKPIEQFIENKNIVIVPDGALALLPFEILRSHGTDGDFYMIEKYKIKYVQSASVLKILRRPSLKKEGQSDRFIGFGDPVYDYDNWRANKPEKGSNIHRAGLIAEVSPCRGYVKAGGKLDRIEGSGKEVLTIKNIFKEKTKNGNENVAYLRLEASEENAKSREMENYGYIHFATHGILEDRFQAIALSHIPDTEEDGMLTLGKIMNCKYNAKLVVLSACQTALGKIERGEGVTGLTRAEMYAGTPAVVVSLWSVSDEGTKELMVRFYKNLIENKMAKEDALREAKIEMIKSKEYHHPFFWAAFILYGE